MRHRVMRTIAGLLGLMMLMTGTARADGAPGVTDDEILLGGVFALSGQFRFVTEFYERGVRAVIDATNEAGGVHGRKIKWVVEDDAYQPAKSLAAAKKLIERDEVFAIVGQVGTPGMAAILPYTEKMRTPVVTSGPMPPPTPKYAFNIMANFGDLTYHLAKHLIKTEGVTKLGYLYQNDDLGEMGRRGLEKALKELNVELAVDVGYERGANDLSTQVLKLRDGGAEAVIAMATAPAIATAMKHADTIGFETIWATHGAIGTNVVHKLLGDKVDGLMFASEMESQFADTPGMQAALEVVHRSFPEAEIDFNLLLGYATGKVAIAGLEAAGRDLTREKFVEAISSFDSLDADVLPLRYGVEKHNGAKGVKIYRWVDGKPTALTDWLPLEAK